MNRFVLSLCFALTLGSSAAHAQQQVVNVGPYPFSPNADNFRDSFIKLNANDTQFFQITGIVKANGVTSQPSAATSGDVIALWNGCTSTSVLYANGVCGSIAPVGFITDALASLSNKPAVGVVITSLPTLSGVQTIDGVSGVANTTLVLVATPTANAAAGPWVMQTGAWTRPAWFPSGGTTQAFQFASERVRLGAVYAGSLWDITTAGNITIDTTPMTWAIKPAALNASTAVWPNSAGTTIASAQAIPQWVHVGNAISYISLAAASTTNSIALFTLPAAGVIHGIKVIHSTAFAGASITAYTVSVGIASNVIRYASAFNVFQAPSGTSFQLTNEMISENNAATTAVVLTAVSTGANLNAASAGVVDVYALLSVAL